ncbi:hypothetical protein NESM_000461300 [Novymonas esmeraldas]|uniref:Uncharacterized protein n=1 Tax=Novymonas esmeraldas TaxID=1808958 RepID=A0AAW0ERC1_9TRYP
MPSPLHPPRRESPPPEISDAESTPLLPQKRRHDSRGSSATPSYRSLSSNGSGSASDEAGSREAAADLRRSSSSSRMNTFNSAGSPARNSSLPSLMHSRPSSSAGSMIPSLSSDGARSGTPLANLAECIDGSRDSGAYHDHENWMTSSIEVEDADTRQAIKALKGVKQARRLRNLLGPAATNAAAAHGAPPESTRSLEASGRKRSVRINIPPEAPTRRRSHIAPNPRQRIVIEQQQQQLQQQQQQQQQQSQQLHELQDLRNKQRQNYMAAVQQQQFMLCSPYSAAHAGRPTVVQLPTIQQVPPYTTVNPLLPPEPSSPESRPTWSTSTSSDTEGTTSHEKSASPHLSRQTPAKRRWFSFCGGGAHDVAPNRHN